MTCPVIRRFSDLVSVSSSMGAVLVDALAKHFSCRVFMRAVTVDFSPIVGADRMVVAGSCPRVCRSVCGAFNIVRGVFFLVVEIIGGGFWSGLCVGVAIHTPNFHRLKASCILAWASWSGWMCRKPRSCPAVLSTSSLKT